MTFRRFALGMIAIGLLAASAPARDLAPGDPAPEFAMKGSDGKTYKLADFKGKQAVVLAWFPKAFTPGCTNECKSFRSDGALLRKHAAAYFTVSCDDPETNRRFAESLGVDYPILSDPGCRVAEAYGVKHPQRPLAQRWTFYIGPDGKILHVDKAVKTATHGADVAKRLKELGVGAGR